MTKPTNIFLRLAALIVLMIMSVGAAWGQTIIYSAAIESSTSKSQGTYNTTGGTYTLGYSSNEETVAGIKLDGDHTNSTGKYVLFNLNETLQTGDLITLEAFSASNPSGNDYGLEIYPNCKTNDSKITTLYLPQGNKNTNYSISYTVQSSDALNGTNKLAVYRASGKSTYFHSITITRTTPVYATESVKWIYGWQQSGVEIRSGIKAFVNQEINLNDYITTAWKTANANYNQGFRWTESTGTGDVHLTGAFITQQGVYKSSTTGEGKGSVFVKTAADTEVQSRFWINVRDKDFEKITIEGVELAAADKNNVITSEVANQTPANNYKLRYTLESTINDAAVIITHNGTTLQAQTDGDGTYYDVELLSTSTPNVYSINVSVGGNYSKTYTLNIINTTPIPTSTNISSFTIGGGTSQAFASNAATNSFASYTDGGQDKTLSVTTESSTATVRLSTKKPATESDMNKVAPWTELTKSGSTHTATLVAPKPGNECYYYIDVEDGGNHAYYELKLTTPAGGTTTAATSSSEPNAFTTDYTYIFDDLTNTGTETPMGSYLLFGDNHFLLGGVISSYPKSQNKTFGDGSHYNSYRLKGLNQTYVAFKLSAGQTVKVYGHSDAGRFFVLTTSKDNSAINSGIVVASSGTEYLEYTATETRTYYLASYSKSGNGWGDGADQYICAIEVEMEKFGTGITTLKVNNQAVPMLTLWGNNYDYGYNISKDYTGTIPLDIVTEATMPALTFDGSGWIHADNGLNHFTKNIVLPSPGEQKQYAIVVTSNSESKTYNLQLTRDTELTTVSETTTWSKFQTTYTGDNYSNRYIKADDAYTYTMRINSGCGRNDYTTSVENGGLILYTQNGKNRTAEIKVSGSGTLTLTTSWDGNCVVRQGSENGAYISGTKDGATETFVYKGGATSLFISTDKDNHRISSITWTPNTDPIEEITFGGAEVTQNTARHYALFTRTAGESLTVSVTKRSATDLLELSKQLASASETPEDYQSSRVTGSGTAASFTLEAPAAANTTYYYKLRVTPAATRAAVSESSDIYVFAVTTRGEDAQTVLMSGESGIVPVNWALHFGEDPSIDRWIWGGESSDGSRLRTDFAAGGITTNGFYLANRDKGSTQLMTAKKVGDDILPTMYLPGGTVKVTLLVSGWEGANRKLKFSVENGSTRTAFENGTYETSEEGSLTTTYNAGGQVNRVDRPYVIINDVPAGNHYLKIWNNSGDWNGIIVYGYIVEQFDDSSASTELQMVKVGNTNITDTRDIYGYYTYTDPADAIVGKFHTLTVSAKSPTATVTYAGPFRAVNEEAVDFTSLGTVMVPNTPSVANYYCIKVEDGGETGYYWVAIQRAATSGDSKVLGHHKIWDGAADFGYSGTDIKFSSNGVLTDGYIKYLTTQTEGVRVLENGLYLSGSGNFGTKDRIVQLKVSGKGTLKVRYTNNDKPAQKLKVLKTGETSATEYSHANEIIEIAHNEKKPTTFSLYSSNSGMYINYLEWIPAADDDGRLPTAEIVPTTGNRVESGSSLTKVFATASFPYGDLTGEIRYTIKSGGNLITETTLTPDATTHELTITAKPDLSTEQILTITATVPINYDYYNNSVDIPITVYPKETSTKLNNVLLGGVVMTKLSEADSGDTFLKEVEADDEASGTFTMTVERTSSTATVSISPALRATVATPGNLTYTAGTSATVYMPEAPGYSTYYYIKVTDDSETAYHLVRLHRKAGANDLEVLDQTTEWSADNGTWVDVAGNIYNTTFLQNQQMLLHMDGSDYCQMGTGGLYLRTENSMTGTTGFVTAVAEIRVSGKGSLYIKKFADSESGHSNARRVKVGIANRNGGITETTIAKETIEQTIPYDVDEPTSIFITENGAANTIRTLRWTPADAVQNQDPPAPANQPYIVWSGTEGFMYGTTDNTLNATAYYHGTEVSGVTYKVVRGCSNIGETSNGNDLTQIDGELSLAGFNAGTVMISASVPAVTTGTNQCAATTSYYIFNVSKQTPTLIVDEIKANVGSNSEKTIYQYAAKLEGVKLVKSGNEISKQIETFEISDSTKYYTLPAAGDSYYDINEDKTVHGKKFGRGSITIGWNPSHTETFGNKSKTYRNEAVFSNYTGTTVTADVVVIGTMTMRFTKTAGTGGCNRPYKAHVLCMDGNDKLEGLTIKYEILSDNTGGATYNADSTAIIPGNKPGEITIKALFKRNPRVNDLNSYYANADTGTERTFTLTVKDANTLTMIDDKEDFTSLNLSTLSWENESRPAASDVQLPTPYQFITDNFYFASANSAGHATDHHHFRFYPANRDELVSTIINETSVQGLYIKDKDSYLSFYARGSAVLQLKGYASVARVVEVWAINDFGWTGNADPHLEDGATKVAEIKVPAGTFDVEQDLAVAGRNYYFIKTSFGGLYLSQVIWKHSRMRPYITIEPAQYTLTPSTHVTNIIDDAQGHTRTPFTIKAWTYAENGDYSETIPNQNANGDTITATGKTAITLKNTATGYTATGATLHFESTDPGIASINPVTSVITPNMPGTVVMYAYIDAGEYNGVKYGSQRTRFTITVTGKVADVFFGRDLNETSVVYSSKTGKVISSNCETGGTWLTPTVRDAETYNSLSPAAYTLEYRLETLDGKPYPTSKAIIDEKTGAVTFPEGSTIADGDEFRVVVKFTSDIYVNQQSYYVVKYTNKLTEPTISYNYEDGMKELSLPTINKAISGTDRHFDKVREYFIPAEEDAILKFELPEPHAGVQMYAIEKNDLSTKPTDLTSAKTASNGKLTVCVLKKRTKVGQDSIYHYQTKYVWVKVVETDTDLSDDEKNERAWNGAYKITFFAKPSKSVSGNSSSTSREVTLTTNNSTAEPKLYYSEDSSTPTGESNLYDSSDKPSYTKNAVLHAVEIFSPTGGFTDGTSNFATNTLDNVEVEINDNSVLAATEAGIHIKPNWENQRVLPGNITDIKKAEMYIMFGADQAHYYNGSNSTINIFAKGGMGWREKNNDTSKSNVNGHDSGIPFYCDIYKEYIQSKDNKTDITADTYQYLSKRDPNPRTEYNGDIGGKGTNSADSLPYMTPISGAFFRLEPKHNGIATIWIRQNGASASSAWGKTHESDATDKTRSDKAQLTRRPVYVMDEEGMLLPNNTSQYNSGYSLLSQYKDINGVCADVSKRSTLDADFMWGWNCFKDYVATDRKTINRKTMAYYHMKYGFYVDFDLDENGDGYFEEFKVSKNSDYKTNTSRSANGADISRIPIDNLIYTDNPEIDEDWKTFRFVAGGYETPMPNYVRYRIPVKAGKTYFLAGRQTKNAFCAVKFEKFDDTAKTVTINESENNTTALAALSDGDLITVTLNRTFTEGNWHPIVLPFSVSETKMREIFGDDVQVLYLDTQHRYEGVGTGSSSFTMPYAVKTVKAGDINGFEPTTCDIMFTKHHYQMLYANTPAFIKPTFKWKARNTNGTLSTTNTEESTDANGAYRKDPWGTKVYKSTTSGKCQRSSITFNNVTYVAGGPKTIDIGAGYNLVGTYDNIPKRTGDLYYITNEKVTKDGVNEWKAVLHHNNTTNGVNFKATRCWIQRRSGQQSAPPITRVGATMFDNSDSGDSYLIASGIDETENELEATPLARQQDPHVYTLQGVTVGCVDADNTLADIFRRLPNGIYIYQGKKMVVRNR